jgi:hypothetical protein
MALEQSESITDHVGIWGAMDCHATSVVSG